MDYKVSAIVLKSIDYGEKDKILTLFSVELGKITARLRGVKSPKSKLKYAGQPFCFGQFELVGEKNTVSGCDLIDSFFDLSGDIDRYNVACKILKTVDSVLVEGVINEKLFLHLIHAIRELTYSDTRPAVVHAKFLLDLLTDLGYGVNFRDCLSCGARLVRSVHLDLSTGSILCNNCAGEYTIPIKAQAIGLLKIIADTPYDKLSSIKSSSFSSAIDILNKIISVHFGGKNILLED